MGALLRNREVLAHGRGRILAAWGPLAVLNFLAEGFVLLRQLLVFFLKPFNSLFDRINAFWVCRFNSFSNMSCPGSQFDWGEGGGGCLPCVFSASHVKKLSGAKRWQSAGSEVEGTSHGHLRRRKLFHPGAFRHG